MKDTFNFRKILTLSVFVFLLLPFFVEAQAESITNPPAGQTPQQGESISNPVKKTFTLSNPLKSEINSVGSIIQAFVEIVSYLAVLAAVLALVWVGFRFILARGDPTTMKELKVWLFWIVVGVAIIIGARLIITIIINTLDASGTVDPGTIQSVNRALNK